MNDNAPVFDQTTYQKSIAENELIDTVILQIHATDRDEGDNARLSYFIDDPTSTFTIDEQSGVLSLRQPLHYEKIRVYTVSIIGKSSSSSRTHMLPHPP